MEHKKNYKENKEFSVYFRKEGSKQEFEDVCDIINVTKSAMVCTLAETIVAASKNEDDGRKLFEAILAKIRIAKGLK